METYARKADIVKAYKLNDESDLDIVINSINSMDRRVAKKGNCKTGIIFKGNDNVGLDSAVFGDYILIHGNEIERISGESFEKYYKKIEECDE